ncbi:MAG: chorismate synthase [Bacteroidota bacterium]|nr:chorismate synthase [Bacteroidota bacterium]MDX5426978.1 chorismate synthase [Bacteroidota bacterium]MDX5448755.1 chorismate synthase [Bacteroidota bacterium]MDX5504966.1 chorismate synthase [Bacteroidota bacterium]
MAGNTIGKALQLTTFGESHGPALGGILDGFPAGIELDLEAVQKELDRRRPGQSQLTTPRKESDRIEILSGIFEGRSTGTPIAFLFRNEDKKSQDYEHLRDVFRPSHADFTYSAKYGHRDHRGGGRSSARETVCRVAAGAIARQLLKNVRIEAWVHQVGSHRVPFSVEEVNPTGIEENELRWPDPGSLSSAIELIERLRDEGDTIGGVIACRITGVPAGWGEPVFDKLHSDLASAMMSINAAKGFDIGGGFDRLELPGSIQNDAFEEGGGTRTNFSGGIQGGISNGQPIYFRVAFKPIATIKKEQDTIRATGEPTILEAKGRHDPTVLPRAVPIVEAMAALVLADHYLRQKTNMP